MVSNQHEIGITDALVPKKGVSLLTTTFLLFNSILGMGMLGLPYAFSRTGWGLGLLAVTVFGTLSCFSLHLIGCCASVVPDSNFNKMALITFPKYKAINDFAVFIKCFGVATGYLIVVGDLVPHALEAWVEDHSSMLLSRQLWIIVFVLLFVAVPACFKTLEALRFQSNFSLLAKAYVILVVVAYAWSPSLNPCLTDKSACEVTEVFQPLTLDTLQVLPIFVFGFTFHQNGFGFVHELQNPTADRCNYFMTVALGLTIITYCIVGYSGYFNFGFGVRDDILATYSPSVSLALGRILLAVNMAFSYPLQSHAGRASLSSMFFGVSDLELPPYTFYGLTMAMLFGSTALALVLDDLGLVFKLVGATASVSIAYVLPAVFYVLYFKDPHTKRTLAKMLIVVGCIFMPTMVAIQLYKALH